MSDKSIRVQEYKLSSYADSFKGVSPTPTIGISRGRRTKDNDLSTDTRHLLKQMMRTSKLSFSQQKLLDGMIQNGGSLPITPFNEHSNEIIHERRQNYKQMEKLDWFYNRPKIRTRQQIQQAGAYDVDMFRTIAMKNMTVEKEKFQVSLEPETVKPKHNQSKEHKEMIQIPEEIDEFTMIEQEIEERRQWLDDMVGLGRGDQYKRQIQNEIRLRIARLEALHKERTRKGI
ncbi:hypothetical protein BC833DRAFT_605499 [Globomyces pollinis-pini]|nr:hypothetical protein BC833DRAFT_605499 [Globomyces pollinis-pini]